MPLAAVDELEDAQAASTTVAAQAAAVLVIVRCFTLVLLIDVSESGGRYQAGGCWRPAARIAWVNSCGRRTAPRRCRRAAVPGQDRQAGCARARGCSPSA